MSARYGAFLSVVVIGVTLSVFTVNGSRVASPEANAVVLLPEAVGERHITRRWHNSLENHTIEEGAVYAGSAAVQAVQLDFYRNSPTWHNGAGCYMAQGETVIWDKPLVLVTREGPAQFDVALLRGQNQLRIVAATECSGGACAESPIGEQLGQGVTLLLRDWQQHKPWSVVPVSVVMVRTVIRSDVEAPLGAEMQQDLEAAIRQIDLAPARKLAALQVAQ